MQHHQQHQHLVQRHQQQDQDQAQHDTSMRKNRPISKNVNLNSRKGFLEIMFIWMLRILYSFREKSFHFICMNAGGGVGLLAGCTSRNIMHQKVWSPRQNHRRGKPRRRCREMGESREGERTKPINIPNHAYVAATATALVKAVCVVGSCLCCVVCICKLVGLDLHF